MRPWEIAVNRRPPTAPLNQRSFIGGPCNAPVHLRRRWDHAATARLDLVHVLTYFLSKNSLFMSLVLICIGNPTLLSCICPFCANTFWCLKILSMWFCFCSPPARWQWGQRDRTAVHASPRQDENFPHAAFTQQQQQQPVPVEEARQYSQAGVPPRMLHPSPHPPQQTSIMVDLHEQVGSSV